jgi:NADH-quinone oxidoreductase subunit E
MDASNDPNDDESPDETIIDKVEEIVDNDSDKVEEIAEDDIEELLEAEAIIDDSDETEEDIEASDDVQDSADADLHDLPSDNLKLIKGVGPAIEKTLNELGIKRFDQIAQMSEYDIDRVAHRLKGFRSRIYREDWIGQARDLHDQKVSGQH